MCFLCPHTNIEYSVLPNGRLILGLICTTPFHSLILLGCQLTLNIYYSVIKVFKFNTLQVVVLNPLADSTHVMLPGYPHSFQGFHWFQNILKMSQSIFRSHMTVSQPWLILYEASLWVRLYMSWKYVKKLASFVIFISRWPLRFTQHYTGFQLVPNSQIFPPLFAWYTLRNSIKWLTPL